MSAMLSMEHERVPLSRRFNPKQAQGAVEKWLIDAEAIMRDTLKTIIKQALQAHAVTDRSAWLLEWPGQVILAVDCLHWTHQVRHRPSVRAPAVSPTCSRALSATPR